MKLRVGAKVKCEIEGKTVTDARLQKEGDRWFICQNVISGINCSDKLGYKYSWSIQNGIMDEINQNDVTELRYSNSTDIRDLYVGCRIKKGNDIKGVLGICNRIIFISMNDNFNAAQGFYTIEELMRSGYKLVPEEEPEEEMIDIDGNKWSVSTVKEALRKHVWDK